MLKAYRMSTEFVIILILFAYIAFLHFQLHRKNAKIERLMSNQIHLGPGLDEEKVAMLIRRLLKEQDTKPPPSKLFDDDVLQYLVEDITTQVLFMHFTKEEYVAKKILAEGFRFSDSFYKTAESITNDKSDLQYKHSVRKLYGKYVILIGIAKSVYNKYLEQVSQSKNMSTVEQLISQKLDELDEDQEDVYLLPPQFIKGYINSETGKIVANSAFNPDFDPHTV